MLIYCNICIDKIHPQIIIYARKIQRTTPQRRHQNNILAAVLIS